MSDDTGNSIEVRYVVAQQFQRFSRLRASHLEKVTQAKKALELA